MRHEVLNPAMAFPVVKTPLTKPTTDLMGVIQIWEDLHEKRSRIFPGLRVRESGWSFKRNDALVHLFDDKRHGVERVPSPVLPPAQAEFEFPCIC